MGATVIAAEPPDWRSVRDQCLALLKSTKDLHVAVTLTRAKLELEGFLGFSEGIQLVVGLVKTQWPTVHPRLDAEDDNDPTARLSAMSELTHRNVLQALRAAPLVVERAMGPVSLRAIDLATAVKAAGAKPAAPTGAPGGAAAASSGAPAGGGLTMAAIEGAFQHAELEPLVATAGYVAVSLEQVNFLGQDWAEKLPEAPLDVTELRKVLFQAQQAIKSRLDLRQAAQQVREPATDEAQVAVRTELRGEVQSRDDVLRAIDAICAYYARSEPSSPVPLLLQRCKRLATMAFSDILKELLPESLPSLQKIAGKAE
jgi:type VI secretion system protein ImpA